MMDVITWIMTNYQSLITALMGFFSAAIAVSLIIPGAEPERTLQKIVDFLAKFSRK